MKYYPSEQLVDEEIAQAGKAVQMFEIEIEKKYRKNKANRPGKQSPITMRHTIVLRGGLQCAGKKAVFIACDIPPA